MAVIPDAERGLARLADRKQLGPALPDARTMRAASLEDAARGLGKVYQALADRDRGLGTWALPSYRNAMGERVLSPQLDAPTAAAFGAGLSRVARMQRYDRYHETVIPELQRSAKAWGVRTLARHAGTLAELKGEVARPGLGGWLHEAAVEIVRDSRDCRAGALERYRSELVGMGYPSARTATLPDVGREDCLRRAASAFLDRESKEYDYVPRSGIAPQLRKRYLDILRIITTLNRFPDLIEAYERSASDGTTLLQSLIDGAARSVWEFSDSIDKNSGSIWRYSVLILGGVRDLGLGGVPGFPEYAVAVGRVYGSRSPAQLLTYVGMGLLVVGLVSTGAGAGLAVLDVLTGGAAAYFNWVRDRQQELAAKASMFLPDQGKFASEYGYGDTALAVAFTLLSALSLLRTARAPAAAPAGPPKPAKPPVPPRGIPEPPAAGAGEAASARAAAPPRRAPEGGAPTEAQRLSREAREVPPQGGPARPPSGARPPATPEPPAVSLREARRRALEQERDELLAAMKERQQLHDEINREIRKLTNQKERARRLGRTKDVEALDEQIEAWRDKYEFGTIVDRVNPDGTVVRVSPESVRYNEIQALLRGTELDYYLALTDAARRQQAFRSVQLGPLHPMFKPLRGASSVEHLYPRIEMWRLPGFEKLSWNQQVFLFSWRKNLMRVELDFNRLRGVVPYRTLKPDVYGEFIEGGWRSSAGRSGLDELARLEAEAAADIAAMVKEPRLIDAMANDPRLLEAVSGNPRLRDLLVDSPGLLDAVRKDPRALDNIVQSLAQTPVR
jgi:hypothetical protein